MVEPRGNGASSGWQTRPNWSRASGTRRGSCDDAADRRARQCLAQGADGARPDRGARARRRRPCPRRRQGLRFRRRRSGEARRRRQGASRRRRYARPSARRAARRARRLARRTVRRAGRAGDHLRQERHAARRRAARRDAGLRHHRRRLGRHLRAADLCRQRHRDGPVERREEGGHGARLGLQAGGAGGERRARSKASMRRRRPQEDRPLPVPRSHASSAPS